MFWLHRISLASFSRTNTTLCNVGTVLLASTKYFFFNFFFNGDYVDLANDQVLVKYHYFWSCQSWDNDASNRHFWGNHLSWAVLAILNQVLHSFYRVFWVMWQGRKILGVRLMAALARIVSRSFIIRLRLER